MNSKKTILALSLMTLSFNTVTAETQEEYVQRNVNRRYAKIAKSTFMTDKEKETERNHAYYILTTLASHYHETAPHAQQLLNPRNIRDFIIKSQPIVNEFATTLAMVDCEMDNDFSSKHFESRKTEWKEYMEKGSYERALMAFEKNLDIIFPFGALYPAYKDGSLFFRD